MFQGLFGQVTVDGTVFFSPNGNEFSICPDPPCFGCMDLDADGCGLPTVPFQIFRDVNLNGTVELDTDISVYSGITSCCSLFTNGNFNTSLTGSGPWILQFSGSGFPTFEDPFCISCNNLTLTYPFATWDGDVNFAITDCHALDDMELFSHIESNSSGEYNATLGVNTGVIAKIDYQIKVRKDNKDGTYEPWQTFQVVDAPYPGFQRTFVNAPSGTYQWRIRTQCPTNIYNSGVRVIVVPEVTAPTRVEQPLVSGYSLQDEQSFVTYYSMQGEKLFLDRTNIILETIELPACYIEVNHTSGVSRIVCME